MIQEGDTTVPRPRRRPAGKTSRGHDGEKVKVTLYLPGDLAKRFAVHATMTGVDKSELFADLVRTHCKRYVIHDRGQADPAEGDAA